MSRYRWQIMPPAPQLTQSDIHPLLEQLLYNRGLSDAVLFEPFLAADERLMCDPFLLPDMAQAVARIFRALLRNELIAVYGDFDTDGVTATAVLTQGLSQFGRKVIPYIPSRLDEGHGLNQRALKELREQGANLVITVDCGITSFDEVQWAQREGLDIVITDHHSVQAPAPPAVAAVNPKLDGSAYPSPDLAGVGVAFKLLQALFQAAGKERRLDEFLDIVAIGTVADQVPLVGENRYLAKRGLEVLNSSSRPGLRELVSSAKLEMGRLDTENISYMLGPRLNAAGRLDRAMLSYELLVSDSPERCRELAAELEATNTERQRLSLKVLTKARERVLATDRDAPLLMVGDQDFRVGVVGVVAGRLADEFYRPAVVMELGPEVSRGSARSIPEFNIVAALFQCRELLSRFGGHAQAAGFTMPSANVEQLHQCLLEIAAKELAGVALTPSLSIDAEIPLSSLSGDTFKLIERLAPFGTANRSPVFLSRGVQVLEHRCAGSKGEHLRLKLRDGEAVWDAMGFDLGQLAESMASDVDIVYNLEQTSWSGTEFLRLNVLDLN